MFKVYTALENFIITSENKKYIKLFLGGGISNCTDWQTVVIENIIKYENLIIFNPRRPNFPIDNPEESEKQIVWEFEHLKISNFLVFWFAKETLNPITLYELGKWGNSSSTKLIIGVDPEYKKKNDVIIQTKLSRPEITVNLIFEDFISNINNEISLLYAKSYNNFI